MQTLYGLKILMQVDKLSYYKELSELYYSLETLIQAIFFQKNNVLKFSDKTMIDGGFLRPFIEKTGQMSLKNRLSIFSGK